MSEELTPLQQSNISEGIRKLYRTEKIVNHDLDFSKWTIKKLYGNTLWIQLLDEPVGDIIMRNGLAVPVNQAKGLYRIARVLMAGGGVVEAKEGDYIRFPHGTGSPYEQIVGGYKTWLLREDHVMMVVNPPSEDEEEIRKLIEDTVLLAD